MGHSRVIAGAQRAWRISGKGFGSQRIITHLLLGGITVVLYLLIGFLVPEGKQVGVLIIALGYLSLLLIGVTLIIGPINLLRSRRNPVNIDLRRDVGIWAAIAGCWHVLLVFRGTVLNGQILQYFLQTGCCGYSLQLNIYGFSNDSGLFATLLLLLLLALSNAVSLRVLKGKWWKCLQRLTYPLALLALAHTFGYQYLNVRGQLFVAVIILTILVLVCQAWGIVLTVSRRRCKNREHKTV
ncbi:MAG TPA: ferric reductase-like transmembrane domain-containing protein [Ktedonobacteraceae bacterium]|nr:ferric reductase-like transmembrane domain-containing protein [Ktedonobacteraceae bacterium]